MTDREKVIRGLECCVDSLVNCFCPDQCPYMDHCWGEDDMYLNLLRDTLAYLKAQEPRVLTLEGVEDALDTVVWLEMKGCENLADQYALIMAYSHKYQWAQFDSPFGDNPSQDRLDYCEYNKEWRCWSARPTDEQRKAVKWE